MSILQGLAKLVGSAGGYLVARVLRDRVCVEKFLLYATSGRYIISVGHCVETSGEAELARVLEFLRRGLYAREFCSDRCRVLVSSISRIPLIAVFRGVGDYTIVELSCSDRLWVDFADPRAELAVLYEDPLEVERYKIPEVPVEALGALCMVATVPIRVAIEDCEECRTVLKLYLPQIMLDSAHVRVLAAWTMPREGAVDEVLGSEWARELEKMGKLRAVLLEGSRCRTLILDVLPSEVFTLPHYMLLPAGVQ